MPTFRTSDDVTLAYTDRGRDAGRPRPRLHGPRCLVGAHRRRPRRCRLPGDRVRPARHGESESPVYGQRMARHGRDLGELLAHLDLEDAVVVGASMGGNTLWAYVDQFGPRALPGGSSSTRPRRCSTPTAGSTATTATSANAAPSSPRGCPCPARPHRRPVGPRRAPPRRAPRWHRRRSATPRRRRPSPLLADHALQDWRDVVRRFPLPLLMLAGRESQIWPCEHAEAAVAGSLHGRAPSSKTPATPSPSTSPTGSTRRFSTSSPRSTLGRRGLTQAITERQGPDEARDTDARRRPAPDRARPRLRAPTAPLWRGLTERIVATGEATVTTCRPAWPRRERSVRRLHRGRLRGRPGRHASDRPRSRRRPLPRWHGARAGGRSAPAPATRSTSIPASGRSSPRRVSRGASSGAPPP